MAKGGKGGDFDLQDFLPYLLNQAAEATSRGFQTAYRNHYGLTRTQWRVMANLGRFGAMTARDICRISHIEKTKVSRAVAGLEAEGLLTRITSDQDRRAENLSLTPKGRAVFAKIGQRALEFDARLRAKLGPEVAARIDEILREIIALQSDAAPGEGDWAEPSSCDFVFSSDALDPRARSDEVNDEPPLPQSAPPAVRHPSRPPR